MKYLKLVTLICLLGLSGCAVKKNKAQSLNLTGLKILCYNIHHANPPSKPDVIDIDAIARVISNSKADLVALQEVDKNTKRSGHIDEAKLLAEKTGMNYRFFKAIDHDGGEYGLAILSRYAFDEEKQLSLPQQIEAEKRILAYVKVKTEGKELIFANTHLDATRTHENRNLQMKYILDHFKDVAQPVILTGDLNSVAGSEAINLLDQQFKRTCIENCPGTIPVINPKRTIDFIAVKNVKWPLLEYQVMEETYASDHRPIAASFNISE